MPRLALLGFGLVFVIAVVGVAVRVLSLQPPPEHLSVMTSPAGTVIIQGMGFAPNERVGVRTELDQTPRNVVVAADASGRFAVDTAQPVTFDCRLTFGVFSNSLVNGQPRRGLLGFDQPRDMNGFAPLPPGYVLYPFPTPGQPMALPLLDPSVKTMSSYRQVTDSMRQRELVWNVGGWLLFVVLPFALAVRLLRRSRPGARASTIGGAIVGLLVVTLIALAVVSLQGDRYLQLLATAQQCPRAEFPPRDSVPGLTQSLSETHVVTSLAAIVVALGCLTSAKTRRLGVSAFPLVVGIFAWTTLGYWLLPMRAAFING